MIISLIAAMDKEMGIGKEGKLPWRLGADLKRFKETTMGHHMIMGRKTYESIGRVLPGRISIVLTRQNLSLKDEPLIARSLDEALELARQNGEEEVFIIGGGQIFSQALKFADRLYLTQVDTNAGCDIFFPDFNLDDWVVIEKEAHSADECNQLPFVFTLLEKKTLSE